MPTVFARAAPLHACTLVTLLCLAGCDKGDKGDVVTVQSPVKINQKALENKVEIARGELAAQQHAFRQEGLRQLAGLDQKIEALKTRAAAGTEQARQKANETLAELSRERDEARAALERAQSASEQQWDALKGGAAEALSRAERAYNEAIERFKTD